MRCMRRTRSSKGSGKAKKGGAGGKYTWEGADGVLTTDDGLEVTPGTSGDLHRGVLDLRGTLLSAEPDMCKDASPHADSELLAGGRERPQLRS